LPAAGTPVSPTPAGVTGGSTVARALVDSSDAGTPGAGLITTGVAARAATTASAAFPWASAATRGAAPVPGEDEDLERYEHLMSAAEDFGEAW